MNLLQKKSNKVNAKIKAFFNEFFYTDLPFQFLKIPIEFNVPFLTEDLLDKKKTCWVIFIKEL